MRRKRLPNGLKKMRKLDKGCLKFGKRLSDVILTLMKTKQPLSLEDISRLGEKFYTEKLKEKLEKEHMGKYAVIDVEL